MLADEVLGFVGHGDAYQLTKFCFHEVLVHSLKFLQMLWSILGPNKRM